MDQEDNRLSARAARYVRVGGRVGGVAARVASQRLFGLSGNDEKNAAELAKALGGLKGPLMKVAQLLSTIPEALPAEYARELAQLQADAPPMGPAFVKRRLVAELGTDWRSNFASFDATSTSSASLGQVHKATLHDGRAVACKLQYPDMASAVESDVGQLKALLGVFNRLDGSIDPRAMVEEISDRLREELDYEREAKNMALYAAMHDSRDFVNTPEPIAELSTDRLLTMSWVTGAPLTDFEVRAKRCATLLRGCCSGRGGDPSMSTGSSMVIRILAIIRWLARARG